MARNFSKEGIMNRDQILKEKLHHIIHNSDIVEKIFEECTTVDEVSGIPWIYILMKGRQVRFSSEEQKEALLAAVREYRKAERPAYPTQGNVAMQEDGFKTFFVAKDFQEQDEGICRDDLPYVLQSTSFSFMAPIDVIDKHTNQCIESISRTSRGYVLEGGERFENFGEMLQFLQQKFYSNGSLKPRHAHDADKKLVEQVIREKGLNQSQLARKLHITPSQINRVLHFKQFLHPLVRKVLKDMLPKEIYCIRCGKRPVASMGIHGECLIGSWIDTSGNFFCEECPKDVKKRPVETCDVCRSAPIVILQDGRKFCRKHIPEQILL
jgi:predicted transcriptional regulator